VLVAQSQPYSFQCLTNIFRTSSSFIFPVMKKWGTAICSVPSECSNVTSPGKSVSSGNFVAAVPCLKSLR